MRIAEIFALFRKSGSKNTMVTSDFRPKVEIQPFRACAMKNVQYNPYLWPVLNAFVEKLGVLRLSGGKNVRDKAYIHPFDTASQVCQW